MKKLLTTTGVVIILSTLFIASREERLVSVAVLGVQDAATSTKKELFNTQNEVVYTDCDLTKPKNTDIEGSLKTYKVKNADDSLRDLDAKDKASLKSCEIAKIKALPRERVQFSGAEYDIEIVDTQYVDGHVEVFARAWNTDGTQIGFGTDGTVDIERFRIFNPPVLVDDPVGNIIREWTDKITGELKQRHLREDSLLAIKQSLVHSIETTTKFGGVQIISGKIGNTTDTFYPDASPETTSVDGYAGNNTPATWATIRAAAGNFSSDTTASTLLGWDTSGGGGTPFAYMYRAFFLFDTSAIADGDTIDSATLSIYGISKADPVSNTPDINIYASTPASNTAIINTDFQQVGSTAFSTAITYASYSTTGYNDFALNASGLSAVTKTGVSKFSARNANKDVAAVSPSTSASGFTGFNGYYADQTGTANDPQLVVVHTASAPVASPSFGDIIYFD